MIKWLVPTGLVGFVFIAWGATWYFMHDVPERGTFGDMFGCINALFSGLAFVGLIVAILLQKKELKLQREELGYTREELKGQKEQLKAQNEIFQHQNFESTFFQLLRLHNEIVSSIDLTGRPGEVISGRDCFQFFHRDLRALWNKKVKHAGIADNLENINKVYLWFYEKRQSEVGHYFKGLYNIVKYIDLSDTSDKKFYTNLIRAQLSSYELALLFYDTLSDLGREKFKPLIEKYSLLKTLDDALIFTPKIHRSWFNNSAFKKGN